VTGRILRSALVAAVLAGTFAAHQFIEYVPPAEKGEVYLPKPQLAKVAALGFDSVMADYYWIQAMYVVGSARRDPSRFPRWGAAGSP